MSQSLCSTTFFLKFKKDNSLQKVNVCILTDGEACTSAYGAEYDRGEGDYVIRARRIDLGVALRDRKNWTHI